MYRFGIVCLVLAATVVVRNDASQITEAQKSKIYGKLLTSGMECMREFPLSLEHIQSFRNKKMPDEEGAKCFTNCLFKHLGVFDDNAKISAKKAHDATKKIFKDNADMLSKVDELISKCIHVNEEETSDDDKKCNRAKLAFECFNEHVTELGLDVEFSI